MGSRPPPDVVRNTIGPAIAHVSPAETITYIPRWLFLGGQKSQEIRDILASWSLDSKQDGPELMGAGTNGRAIDFAVAMHGWPRQCAEQAPGPRPPRV